VDIEAHTISRRPISERWPGIRLICSEEHGEVEDPEKHQEQQKRDDPPRVLAR
jgi:hypothetical protein